MPTQRDTEVRRCTSAEFHLKRQLVAKLLPHLVWRRHGIGVLQAYVYESPTETEIRVHIWSRHLMLDGIRESGNAHNHRFDMRSHVLAGVLRHEEWQPVVGFGHCFYDFVHARAHTEDTRALMTKIGDEVGIVKVGRRIHQGSTYTFSRGAFHVSEPITDVVVTLVEKHNQRDIRAHVCAPADMPPVPAFGGPPVPEEIQRRVLAGAMYELNRG